MSITQRIDSITRIPESHLGVILPAPKAVKIELTAACDFKCFFCATGKNLRPKSHMDFDLFKRIARDMRDSGVQELGMFYLGESFLYKRLPEAIEYAKNIGFPYVFLTTNGWAATEDKLEAVMRAGLDSLKFSFNWANAEQCQQVTGRSAFDTCLQHVKDARRIRDQIEAETGHRTGLYASSIRYDGDQQLRMAETATVLRQYVDEHYYLPLYNQAGFVTDDEKKRGLLAAAGNRGRLDALVPPLPCWAMFTEGHVAWDGTLTGCCFSHTPDFDFGDLRQMSFMDAWNSPKAQEFRAAHLAKDVSTTACASCFSGSAA